MLRWLLSVGSNQNPPTRPAQAGRSSTHLLHPVLREGAALPQYSIETAPGLLAICCIKFAACRPASLAPHTDTPAPQLHPAHGVMVWSVADLTEPKGI